MRQLMAGRDEGGGRHVGARANLGDASLRVLLPLLVALHLLLVMFLTRSEYGKESV
jgi:hypothetical protein